MSETNTAEPNGEVNHEVLTQQEPRSKPIVRICEHIKDDGIRCGTPAVTGRHFCYYHCRIHHPGARIATRRYRAPIPESVASLQVALAHALQGLGSGDISPKQANSMMYGIHLGTNLLHLSKPLSEADKLQVATEIPDSMQQILEETRDDNSESEQQRESASVSSQTPPISQAQLVVDREIRKLRAMCQTSEALRQYEEDLRSFKGTSDPKYYTAVNRVYEHRYAVEKLQEMGVL